MVRWRKAKLGSINKAGRTRVGVVQKEGGDTGRRELRCKLFINVISQLVHCPRALGPRKARGCESEIKSYGLVKLSKSKGHSWGRPAREREGSIVPTDCTSLCARHCLSQPSWSRRRTRDEGLCAHSSGESDSKEGGPACVGDTCSQLYPQWVHTPTGP